MIIDHLDFHERRQLKSYSDSIFGLEASDVDGFMFEMDVAAVGLSSWIIKHRGYLVKGYVM